MKKIFHSALGLITGLLLAGTVSAQEPNGTNRVSASHDTLSESSRQNPSSLNISNLGKLPVEPAATKRDSDKPSKWNSEGKMFLNMYRQSQQKGEDTKQLRKQLQDQFGMRSMGKTKSKKDYVPVFLSYNDPSALDDAKKLGFIPQTDEEEALALKGIDLEQKVDKEQVDAKDAWDEYEDIRRYILYTPEELEEKKQREEEQAKRETFMSTGPERLDTAEVNIDDLQVTMTDMFLMM